jgi:hypothetical protein
MVTKEMDAGQFLEDFIYETKRVNNFFLQDLKSIKEELKKLKAKYEVMKKQES